jgi:predicted transcriptional regulator
MNAAYQQAVMNGSTPVLDFAVYFPCSADKVLGKTMRYADKKGYSFASIDRIAWECGISRSLTKNALKFLEAQGFIECTGGAKGGTHVTKKYILHYDAIYEMQALWKESRDSEPPVIEILDENEKSKKKTVVLEYLKYQTSQKNTETSQKSYANQSESDYKESSKKEYKKQFANAHDFSKPQSMPTWMEIPEVKPGNEVTVTDGQTESISMPKFLNEDQSVPVIPDTTVPETKDEYFVPLSWEEEMVVRFGGVEQALREIRRYNPHFEWQNLPKEKE